MASNCLERISIEERHEQEAKSDYQRDNQYSALHEDAKASSGNGKGVGGSHSHWLPNCSGTIGVFNYTNFKTQVSDGAGCDCDIKMRERSLGRSLYSADNAYSALSVDTSKNVSEGQFQNVFKRKTARVCNNLA